MIAILMVLVGLLLRNQFMLVAQLREAQAGLAAKARAEERNRISRDLHDVIAHSLTVSLLHVMSARLAVESDPDDAARSLAEAERLGRESLAEVRQVDKKNLAIEALKKLINGDVRSQAKRNVVQSKAFSERLEAAIARYHANAITTAIPSAPAGGSVTRAGS